MNKLLLALSFVVLASAPSFAAQKTYQVTGPVLAFDDQTVTVQKGKEKWVLNLDASSTKPADLKVGDKVTIQYTMTAASIAKKGK